MLAWIIGTSKSVPADAGAGRLHHHDVCSVVVRLLPKQVCWNGTPAYIQAMPRLEACRDVLRRLIAKGEMDGLPLATRTIDEYFDATPTRARTSGLLLLRQDVLDQRNAILGSHRDFADAVNGYIQWKLIE